MIHQLNEAHQRVHTITHDRTFNEKPLYYHKDGLVLEYLEEIDRVLTEALNQYLRIFAVHINLNLPSDFEGDYLVVFAHFFRIAYFGAFRSVISGLSDHPFRDYPITDSAIIRSLLA